MKEPGRECRPTHARTCHRYHQTPPQGGFVVGETIGSHYRNREGRTAPATTTSSDLAGLNTGTADVNLDDMTRLELLEHARNLGLDVKQNTAKADIRAAIDNA